MKRLILFITAIILYSVTFGQNLLVGKWKLTKLSYNNHFSKSTNTIFEVGKVDSIKKELLRLYSTQDSTDSELVQIDTVEFKAKLEKDFKYYQLVTFQIKGDKTFFMKSFGLIIPTSEPGWHFGDKLFGSWTRNDMDLKLTVGDKKIYHIFFYKIIELTKNRLILSQTNEDYKEIFNQIIFVRH